MPKTGVSKTKHTQFTFKNVFIMWRPGWQLCGILSSKGKIGMGEESDNKNLVYNTLTEFSFQPTSGLLIILCRKLYSPSRSKPGPLSPFFTANEQSLDHTL